MSSLGYSCKSLIGNHDVYYKKPIYNFELHKRLMSDTSPYYQYFEKVWTRAVKDNDNDYGYHMKRRNPILNNYPVIYPILCIARIFRVFSNHATIKKEAVAVKI